MKGYAGTTPTVEAIGRLGLTGNIIPRTWAQWLKYDNGKPNPVAIMILAELVYWYRPIEDIDENTGKVIGWRRKFKADILQKSYQDLSDSLGFTKRQVSENVRWLESKGILSVQLRHFSYGSNIAFIDLNPEAIERISFSIPELDHLTLECNPSHIETLDGLTVERDTYTEITSRDHQTESNNKYKQILTQDNSAHVRSTESIASERDENSSLDGRAGTTEQPSSQTSTVSSTDQKTPSPTPPPLPQVEAVPSSTRVRQQTPAKQVVFEVNDLGWLRMPRQKQYKLACWLTTLRMSYQLSTLFSNVDIARNEKGDVIWEKNQIAFKFDDRVIWEKDMFGQDSWASLQSVRDELYQKGMISQDTFNDVLEVIFMDSLVWLKEQGQKLKRCSIATHQRSPSTIAIARLCKS